MSTKIGAGWYKFSDNGAEYVNLSINKELLPLTITEEHSLILFAETDKDKKNELAPTHRLVLDKKQKKG